MRRSPMSCSTASAKIVFVGCSGMLGAEVVRWRTCRRIGRSVFSLAPLCSNSISGVARSMRGQGATPTELTQGR
ncbi:hypothetical protein ES707_22104 [subsurface metagenome]